MNAGLCAACVPVPAARCVLPTSSTCVCMRMAHNSPCASACLYVCACVTVRVCVCVCVCVCLHRPQPTNCSTVPLTSCNHLCPVCVCVSLCVCVCVSTQAAANQLFDRSLDELQSTIIADNAMYAKQIDLSDAPDGSQPATRRRLLQTGTGTLPDKVDWWAAGKVRHSACAMAYTAWR